MERVGDYEFRELEPALWEVTHPSWDKPKQYVFSGSAGQFAETLIKDPPVKEAA